MHRQLVFNSPEAKETIPPSGKRTWEFMSLEHSWIPYQRERKGLLADMVTQGTWAKSSVPPRTLQVCHLPTSYVTGITSSWQHYETAKPTTATLALKNPLCSLSAEWEQWYIPVLPGCSHVERSTRGWSIQALLRLANLREPPTGPGLPEATRQHSLHPFIKKIVQRNRLCPYRPLRFSHRHMKPRKQTTWFHGRQFKEEAMPSLPFALRCVAGFWRPYRSSLGSTRNTSPIFLVLVLDAQHF